MDMEVRSLPDQQAQRIFYFHMYYHKEILFGLIESGADFANFSFNSSTSMFPLDSNPGGVYDINKFAAHSDEYIVSINPNPLDIKVWLHTHHIFH